MHFVIRDHFPKKLSYQGWKYYILIFLTEGGALDPNHDDHKSVGRDGSRNLRRCWIMDSQAPMRKQHIFLTDRVEPLLRTCKDI